MANKDDTALQYAIAKIEALATALHATLEAIDRGAANVRNAAVEDLNAEAKRAYDLQDAMYVQRFSEWPDQPMRFKYEALTELADQLKGQHRKG
jgi:hypothetical protein